MTLEQHPKQGLFYFGSPYTDYLPVPIRWSPQPTEPGSSVVWMLADTASISLEVAWLKARPRDLPLFIVLPHHNEILPIASIVRQVPDLRPRAVIPSAGLGLAKSLQTLLAAPPRTLPAAVVDYLKKANMVPDIKSAVVIQTILRLAPQVSSIERLSGRMCQSRRTLGRFFQERELPVPSHWLQFARVLHVAIQIQNTRTSLNRIAGRFGYPDGFTMSNSMKRLTGYRPSFVRTHLGWEWVVEAWIQAERG